MNWGETEPTLFCLDKFITIWLEQLVTFSPHFLTSFCNTLNWNHTENVVFPLESSAKAVDLNPLFQLSLAVILHIWINWVLTQNPVLSHTWYQHPQYSPLTFTRWDWSERNDLHHLNAAPSSPNSSPHISTSCHSNYHCVFNSDCNCTYHCHCKLDRNANSYGHHSPT